MQLEAFKKAIKDDIAEYEKAIKPFKEVKDKIDGILGKYKSKESISVLAAYKIQVLVKEMRSDLHHAMVEEGKGTAPSYLNVLENLLNVRKQDFYNQISRVMDDPYLMRDSEVPGYLSDRDKKRWEEIQKKLKDTAEDRRRIERPQLGAIAIAEGAAKSSIKNSDEIKDYVREHAYDNYDLGNDIKSFKADIQKYYIDPRIEEIGLKSMKDELITRYQSMEKVFDKMESTVGAKFTITDIDSLKKIKSYIERSMKDLGDIILRVLSFGHYGERKRRYLREITEALDNIRMPDKPLESADVEEDEQGFAPVKRL